MEPPRPADPPRPRPFGRPRLTGGRELALAVLPTVTAMAAIGVVDEFTGRKLLFASLASSALLIYLDPDHEMNRVGVVLVTQFGAAVVALLAVVLIGSGTAAAAVAMAAVILAMAAGRAVHPPAASSAVAFAYRLTPVRDLGLFAAATLLVAGMVVVQRLLLRRLTTAEAR